MDPKQYVYTCLQNMGIAYQITEHPPVYTIEEMDRLTMPYPECVVKNLFLRDDKKRSYYLLVLSKHKKADLKKLRQTIGSQPLSFAPEAELLKLLGLYAGSVTPLGILNDEENRVQLVMDKDLFDLPRIGVHPNENTATVWIKPQDLLLIARETGHAVQQVVV
ncbi:MAG: prolyl-tRNA synthetase associated domain-containing protein [Pygmaiobacter massiliensis]|nr:prolyl-tRNA synthetase associated domain-containing protein [Pygmaiobacter massiliensis]